MPARNRQLTKQRILEAGRLLLREKGFEAWGVNAVARTAATDKVLIYRYFDSLDGLLGAIAEETVFWPDPASLPQHSAEAFIGRTRDFIAARPETLALLAHPRAREPLSRIQRISSGQLDQWIRGFGQRVHGSGSSSLLYQVAASIVFNIQSVQPFLSDSEIWKSVSPPLFWKPAGESESNAELPIELL